MEIILKEQLPQAAYFTRKNLELILGKNRRTLDNRIRQLIKTRVISRLKPGFYLNRWLLNKTENKEAMLEYIGSVLRYPAYVSLEYALSQYGLIPEGIYNITCITLKKTANYTVKDLEINFSFRNLKKALFTGYKTRKFGRLKYGFATKPKALFDFIYLTPLSSYTLEEMERVLLESRINWQNVSRQERQKLIKWCKASKSRKMMIAAKIISKKIK